MRQNRSYSTSKNEGNVKEHGLNTNIPLLKLFKFNHIELL